MVATPEIRPKHVARRYRVSEKWVRDLARRKIASHRPHQPWAWRGWDDPDLKLVLERLENGREIDEIDEWDLTISRKNQITLPVNVLKALKAKSGDRLRAAIRGRSLVLLPHPVSWVEYYAGIAEGLYGQTDEEIEAYIRESRGDWEPLEE